MFEFFLLFLKAHDFRQKKIRSAANCLIIFGIINFLQHKVLAHQNDTLPESISNSSIIVGHLDGLDQKFTNDGSLVKLKDQKSIEFDAETIAKFNPEATTLVETLNRFGLYNAGDLFNLGTLEIDSHPTVNYFAPTYAYGINSAWTMAFAVPAVRYTNTVDMKQSFSNKAYYEQFRGLSRDLDAALDTDLAVATQNTLKDKGYNQIENQNQNFLGDLQLISLYKFWIDTKSHFVHNLNLNLPTGPAYNADNLLALNNFHKFYIENVLSYSYILNSFFTISPFIGFKYFLPIKVTIRVPKDDKDTLPDQNSKQDLYLQDGFNQEFGTLLTWNLNDDFSITTSYKIGSKSSDKYSQPSIGTAAPLEKNTWSNWQKYSVEINYSMVKSFLKKQSPLPMNLSFKTFDTLYGKNIEKQQGQELTISLYF